MCNQHVDAPRFERHQLVVRLKINSGIARHFFHTTQEGQARRADLEKCSVWDVSQHIEVIDSCGARIGLHAQARQPTEVLVVSPQEVNRSPEFRANSPHAVGQFSIGLE